MAHVSFAHPSVSVAVVYASGASAFRATAAAVAEGVALVPGAEVDLVDGTDALSQLGRLDRADAIVWGSPTSAAGVAGSMGQFLELTHPRQQQQAWADKLAAGFTVLEGSEGDGWVTLQALCRFSAQHGMVWVPLGRGPAGPVGSEGTEPCLGAVAGMSHGELPGRSGLAAARRLGERVAREALRRAHRVSALEDERRREIESILALYFDGLYHADVVRLRAAFHPNFRFVNATDGGVPHWTLEEYLAVVAKREPPSQRGELRTDRVLSIDFAGDRAAIARVRCSLAPRHFEDLLTLTRDQHGWRILFKVFHYETVADRGPTG